MLVGGWGGEGGAVGGLYVVVEQLGNGEGGGV